MPAPTVTKADSLSATLLPVAYKEKFRPPTGAAAEGQAGSSTRPQSGAVYPRSR